MTFRSDDRGVTVQVGAILLFAMLVVAMSLYQATAIPSQNAKVEFRHDERVQSQMQDVRNTILRTAATGAGQPTSVTLGTQYPGHVFFVNPPPASGTLRTRELGNLSIENLHATNPETEQYFDGSEHSFSTRSLVYAPDYNQYDNAPATVYENSIVYNRGRDGNATLTDQQLIHGKRISLVTLDGNLSQSQSGTVSLDPHAVSPSTETRSISVQSAGSDPVISVPTTLSKEKWNRLLADQKESGYVEDVHVEGGILRLTLRGTEDGTPVTYDLRMAKVGVGSGAKTTSEEYVTNVSPLNVMTAGNATLVAEVRDRYNNPVSGVTVTASGGTVAQSHRTDERGRVRFEYEPDPSGDGTVTLSIGNNSAERERIEFLVHAVAGDINGIGGGSYDVEWVASNGLDCNPSLDECTLDRGSSATLTANVTYRGHSAIDGEQPVTGTNVDFGLNRTGILDTSPTGATTDLNGRARTKIEASSTGDVTLFAASGGDADPVTVHVVQSGDVPGIVYNEDVQATDGYQYDGTKAGLVFSVTNHLPEDAMLTDIRIAPRDTSIDTLSDPSRYVGKYRSELYVSAKRDGATDIGNGGPVPRTIDIDRDGQNLNPPFRQNPIIAGNNGTATFYLYRFLHHSTPVDMSNEPVDITLTFANHDPVSFTLNGNDDGGGNGGNDARTPRIGMRVDDLSHVDQDKVLFATSYDVTNTNSSFERVRVVTDDLRRGNDATETNSSSAKRGSSVYQLNYGSDERWRMTVQVVYERADGTEYVAAERSIDDRADSLNPSNNDDLSTPDSATIDSYSLNDYTRYGQPRYTLGYDLSSGSDFGGVVGAAISRGNGDAAYDMGTQRRGSFQLNPSYGGGTTFTIKLLVYDSDRVVVDSVERSDTAG